MHWFGLLVSGFVGSVLGFPSPDYGISLELPTSLNSTPALDGDNATQFWVSGDGSQIVPLTSR